ncbi:MAG: hypothetical protein NTU54_08490, partial [Candidatus Omnitrophica bacterium]|nr:hypothetical protein [Candidatus Omnitrophota bacterium]
MREVPARQEADDHTLAYYYKIAAYYRLDAAEQQRIVEVSHWYGEAGRRDPACLLEMLTLTQGHNLQDLPDITSVYSIAARQYGISLPVALPNQKYVRIRSALLAKISKDSSDRGFDPNLYAVAVSMHRGIFADSQFGEMVMEFFAAMGAFNESKVRLQDAWKKTKESKNRIATAIAGTRNAFVIVNKLAGVDDVSDKAIIWSLFYKISGSVMGRVHSSHLDNIYAAADRMEKRVERLYGLMREFFIWRMKLPADLIDLGVAPVYKSRFQRMVNISCLKINKYPTPKVVRNMPVADLDSGNRVNIVRCSVWGHNTLFMLLPGRNGKGLNFISSHPGRNFIEVSPWEQPFIRDGVSLKFRCGLFVDKTGELTLAEFSEPLTIHYISTGYKLKQTREIEKLGIPYQCATPIHVVARDKRIATDAARSVSGLRIPRELDIEGNVSPEEIRARIRGFASLADMDEIFIKPPKGMGGRGILSFNTRTELEEAVKHAVRICKDEGVIIQESVVCPLVEFRGAPAYWNLRVFISRDENARIVVGETAVRIGHGKVVNICKGAGVITLEALLALLGITGEAKRAFLEEFNRVCVLCFEAVERKADSIFDGGYHREILGGLSYADADHIGLDLMWDGKDFCFIEANDYSGGLSGLANAIEDEDGDAPVHGSIDAFYVTAERKARVYKQALEGLRQRKEFREYGARLFDLAGAKGLRFIFEALDHLEPGARERFFFDALEKLSALEGEITAVANPAAPVKLCEMLRDAALKGAGDGLSSATGNEVSQTSGVKTDSEKSYTTIFEGTPAEVTTFALASGIPGAANLCNVLNRALVRARARFEQLRHKETRIRLTQGDYVWARVDDYEILCIAVNALNHPSVLELEMEEELTHIATNPAIARLPCHQRALAIGIIEFLTDMYKTRLFHRMSITEQADILRVLLSPGLDIYRFHDVLIRTYSDQVKFRELLLLLKNHLSPAIMSRLVQLQMQPKPLSMLAYEYGQKPGTYDIRISTAMAQAHQRALSVLKLKLRKDTLDEADMLPLWREAEATDRTIAQIVLGDEIPQAKDLGLPASEDSLLRSQTSGIKRTPQALVTAEELGAGKIAFFMTKPDADEAGVSEAIINDLEEIYKDEAGTQKRFEILSVIVRENGLPADLAAEFYRPDHGAKPLFLKALVNYMGSGAVSLIILRCDPPAYKNVREVVGHWKGNVAGTLRAKYGVGYKKFPARKRDGTVVMKSIGMNKIHASNKRDNEPDECGSQAAMREIYVTHTIEELKGIFTEEAIAMLSQAKVAPAEAAEDEAADTARPCDSTSPVSAAPVTSVSHSP